MHLFRVVYIVEYYESTRMNSGRIYQERALELCRGRIENVTNFHEPDVSIL